MGCEQQERIFKNTCIAVNIKSKKILSMKVTDDEHVHDSKALPEIIEKIIESDDNVTAIGKLLGDEPMKVMMFLDIYLTMESVCHVL